MIEINGKKYKINTDTTLLTEKFAAKISEDPDNPKNFKYIEYILKDLLIPTPSGKELNKMRRSQREMVFEKFAEEMNRVNAESKKKRSLL